MAVSINEWMKVNADEISRIKGMVPFVNEQSMICQFLDAGLKEYSSIADMEEVINAHRDELSDDYRARFQTTESA